MSEAVKMTCLNCGQTNRVPLAKLDAGPKCAKCRNPLTGGSVAELDPDLHDKATGRDEVPIVVDYWAPWCGPCKMMAPEFAKAAAAVKPNARFAKIDTEQYPQISQRLGIRGIPLLIMYVRGKEVARLAGARPAHDIEAFVRQNARHGDIHAGR